jgi:CDP-glucose 4,6-dehydratase
MENLVEVFRGKKVFITGHTGFKGSWMTKWLSMIGADIKGYALAPENNYNLFYSAEIESCCQSVIANILNADNLKKEIEEFQPDFVFHLAAQTLVRLSYDIPIETFNVNIMGTANVLEAIKGLKKPVITVMITTDKVYENIEQDYYYKESDRLGGYDPYSASKAAAELVISSYRNSFFNNTTLEFHNKSIASARAGNVIGGGDWAKDRIIPDIVRALNSNIEIEVRNPKAVRPWQHVLEPISGYLHLAANMSKNKAQYNDSWNFGPEAEDTYTVEDFVKIALGIWGEGTYKFPNQTNAPHEAGLLKLDIEKSKKELSWHPKLNSKQAIEWTLDFYKSNDPKNYIEKQIKEYQAL